VENLRIQVPTQEEEVLIQDQEITVTVVVRAVVPIQVQAIQAEVLQQ
jgi:hypothetical protein